MSGQPVLTRPRVTSLRASELVDPGRQELAAHLREIQYAWSCTPAVAAALFWKQYSWFVVQVALEDPRADLRLAAVQLQLAMDPPYIAVETTPTEAAPDDDLAARLATHLIAGHLRPFVERLNAMTRAGQRLLWGSVAHALAYPLAERTTDPAREVPAFLAAVGPEVAGLVDVDASGEIGRRTCCLAFRCGTPSVCDYCPIQRLDRPGRRAVGFGADT
ncbi:IucA/IucC family C-terminal-domain containing protein [Actinopolymorpha sp. B11F2]|uniref:IucA/IucC family C-terminal-domain containing protein n=1 Tax=Actinopolymorpha sp. B11F2 TaxID=3160862 RepID=UPI0032E44032